MVPGNRTRLDIICKNLFNAASQNYDAARAQLAVLQAIRELVVVAEDLAFRPEVNS